MDELNEEIIESVDICHKFIRDKYDKSLESMGEIKRFDYFLSIL